jgi:transposase
MERGSNRTDRNEQVSGAREALALLTRARNAGGVGAEAGPGRRFSAKRKLAAVQCRLRGKSLEVVLRELNVLAHRLSEWRERALLGAESALEEREPDARDAEIERLKAKLGEITMANELLYAKIDKLEAGRPLAVRRSRP